MKIPIRFNCPYCLKTRSYGYKELKEEYADDESRFEFYTCGDYTCGDENHEGCGMQFILKASIKMDYSFYEYKRLEISGLVEKKNEREEQ